MKTFKQFTEQYTPKGTFTYPYDTRDGGLLDKIRTKDAKDYENAEFLRNKEKEKIEFKKGTKFKLPLDLVKK